MTPTQMLTGLFVGIVILLLIITFITLFLKKFKPYYYGKMDKATERIYLRQLGNSDIPIHKTLDNLERVNSFVQNQGEGEKK